MLLLHVYKKTCTEYNSVILIGWTEMTAPNDVLNSTQETLTEEYLPWQTERRQGLYTVASGLRQAVVS